MLSAKEIQAEIMPVLWAYEEITNKSLRQVMVRGSKNKRCKMPPMRKNIHPIWGTYLFEKAQGNKVGYR